MSFTPKMNLLSAVDSLPINPSLIYKLKKANLVSFKKILNFSLPELQRVVKISSYEANIIFQAVSAVELKSDVVDAFSMLNDTNTCQEPLSFEFFNSCNNYFDGIYTGTITEICGESGSGKTQLCLLLSICAIMPKHLGGLASKVVYIHSEGEFPITRFVEISKSFKDQNYGCKDLNFTDDLILKKVYNLKETMHVLQNGLPDLLQKKAAPKLLILDSVAALLRSEYDSFNLRNLMIQQLAVELWKIANIHNMAVICVNQISGSIQKVAGTSTTFSADIPSLGLLWANVLTTRLQIFRKNRNWLEMLSEESTPEKESAGRVFEVVFSAYHPRLSISFVITGRGIELA